MKKILFLAAVTAIALTACTKTETTAVSEGNVIRFDNAFVGNPTKAATEVTDQNIEKFFVYGGYATVTNVFENDEVSKNANGEWTYVNQEQWVNNQDYKFAAYSPDVEATFTFDYSSGNLSCENYTVNPEKNQKDFLYATATQNSGDGSTTRPKVQFNFEHMLSMVKFTLKSGFGEGVKLTINNFEFYGMTTVADFTSAAWSNPETRLDEGSGFKTMDVNEATINANVPTDATAEYFILPQSFENDVIVAKFDVTISGTGITSETKKSITAKIPKDEWVKGYRYNYVATIDGQTLDFITFAAPEVIPMENETINLVNDATTPGTLIGE